MKPFLLLIGDTVDGLVSLLIIEVEKLEPGLIYGEEIMVDFLTGAGGFFPIFLSSCGVSYKPTFFMVELLFLDMQNAMVLTCEELFLNYACRSLFLLSIFNY
jgi:hypothetical protein